MLPAIHHRRAASADLVGLLRYSQRPQYGIEVGTNRNIWNPNIGHSRSLFMKSKPKRKSPIASITIIGIASVVLGGSLTYSISKNESVETLPATNLRSYMQAAQRKLQLVEEKKRQVAAENAEHQTEIPLEQGNVGAPDLEETAWSSFSKNFATFSSIADLRWGSTITDYIFPEWAKVVPDYINKLQKELSMSPGSLADEIWQEAHDSYINPEIEFAAKVRVSEELCDEEKEFLHKRKKVTRAALAKYLDIPVDEIHSDDVPTIAMVGSGGGLRALVAGAGSYLAAGEAGLFDCVTYTAGVSGSCWLQALFHSSLGGRRLDKLVDHLRARIGVHIAYPPVALSALTSAPTNKFLLSGFVEKLKGDTRANFGLVDVYGLMLAARLLVPKGDLGVDDRDLKISNQRAYLKHGENPMPIYTAVRHEIPLEAEESEEERRLGSPSSETKEKAKKEAWFQWFEITPYEMFCEEFAAGIPTWALGRKFENGKDISQDVDGLRVPEMRLSLLLGVFGSAFCATLAHYYKEIQPVVKGLAGLGGIDDLIEERNDDLSKVHPIDPATIPNFAYGMRGRLAETTPESIYKNTHIQLMDAGMSNNLPIYPLLRPGRDVDILIAFDASADVKSDNWLSVASGYARQRGIKGWPIGVGWPKANVLPEKAVHQIDDAQVETAAEAESKIEAAKANQAENLQEEAKIAKDTNRASAKASSGDLGHCTVWIGTTEERSSATEDVPSKAVEEDWEIMSPNAGIAVIYFPFLKNDKVAGVDPMVSEFMSTWNFVYTPENIDKVVELARANFDEGKEQTRRCVRAVYERKKKLRLEREDEESETRWRRKVRLGIVGKKGEGDHFHLT